MGWWQRHIEGQAYLKQQEETKAKQAAERAAKAAKQAKTQQEQMDAWKNAYNTGGDQGLADYIIENGANTRNGASGFAKQVKAGNLTFKELGAQQEKERYETWQRHTAGNETYGAQNQTLKQLMPWKSQEAQFSWAEGWVDPQIQIDKDNAAKKAAEDAAAAKAAEAAKKQEQENITNLDNEKNQSVQNAFTNQAPNKPREEAVERAQEYQNNASNKPVSNTEKSSTTESSSWSNSGYVQQLADDKLNNYKSKWRGGGQTTNYSNVFNNNINQKVGNSGDWKTSFGNNNKLNNVSAGNNYTLNLGNIDLKNNRFEN